MSKKWITILVAAVVGALVFVPTAAMANCQVSIVGPLALHDKTKAATWTDPTPTIPGDAVDGVANAIGNLPATGPFLNGEGQAERLADLLIYDATGAAGATFCFNAGNVITITFNGVLTNPAVGTSLSQVNNMDVYDSNGIGGLSITSATVGQAFAANTTQTIITITVGAAGTTGGVLYPSGGGATGSALRVKNLRIDATSVTGGTGTAVNVNAAQGINPVTVFIGTTGAGPNVVGTKLVTNGALATPAAPAAGVGTGVQNSGAGLRSGAPTGAVGASGATAANGFTFTPGFSVAYRLAGGSCQTAPGTPASNGSCVSGVSNDIATGATSLAFAISGIPSGVTVTFPSKIDTTATNGVGGALTFTASTTTLNNAGAPGTLPVTYKTTAAGAAPGPVTVETADNADSGTAIGGTAATNTNPNCTTSSAGVYPSNLNSGSPCDTTPKIGVLVGAASAAGTATLNLAFGPSDTSLFTGDDAATTGLIPRYTGSATPTSSVFPAAPAVNAVFSRYIVKAKSFFTITPTRTTLLFPFMSTVGNFNSGLSIINSCADSLGSTANSVYGTSANSLCNQTGGVTIFFFGVDPTNSNATVATSINTDLTQGGVSVSSACRGLDSNGRLAPGKGMACSLAALLPLLTGAPKGFDGYVIVVAAFNNGHGFSAQFNAAGSPFGANPALVLGAAARTAGDFGNGAGN